MKLTLSLYKRFRDEPYAQEPTYMSICKYVNTHMPFKHTYAKRIIKELVNRESKCLVQT